MTVSNRPSLGLYEQATRFYERGRYREALPLAEQACEPGQGQDPTLADSLTLLADLHRELGHFAQAEQPYLQALSIKAASLGKEHPGYARTLHGLARLYEWTGQYAQAAPLFDTALAIRRRALGEHHPDYAQTLHDI
ncbi:MAG TPA: tetratricopeptide repeat protein, partial [Gemmataceae bacterium]|nr:tetratricopeptide repeat protein [Gemmataceae bacterium]